MGLTDGSSSYKIHIIQAGGDDALGLLQDGCLSPFKTNLQSIFGHFSWILWSFFGQILCSCPVLPCGRCEILWGSRAVSSCIHDKSFKNPSYWYLDTRANSPLEFFFSVCYYFIYRGQNVGKLLSQDAVSSFWQLVLEVRDIPNSHPDLECLAVIPAVDSCFSGKG